MNYFVMLLILLIFIPFSNQKAHFLSVVSMFKNEELIMREWLEHYISEGVDHFFLIDNGSDDNYWRLIDDFLQQNKVTIFKDPNNWKNMQSNLLVHFFTNFVKHHSDYILTVDLDEFAYAREPGETLRSILMNPNYFSCDDHRSVGQILIHWKTYGTSNYKVNPGLVIPNLVFRGNLQRSVHQFNLAHFKSITKTDAVRDDIQPLYGSVGIHFFFLKDNEFCSVFSNNKTINQDLYRLMADTLWDEDSYKDEKMYINHYVVRSEEFYYEIKGKRGYLAHLHEDYFQIFNNNDIFDDELVRRKMNSEEFAQLNSFCVAKNFREITKKNNKYDCKCQKGFLDIGIESCIDENLVLYLKNCEIEQIQQYYLETLHKCEKDNFLVIELQSNNCDNNPYICVCPKNYIYNGKMCVPASFHIDCTIEDPNKEIIFKEDMFLCTCKEGYTLKSWKSKWEKALFFLDKCYDDIVHCEN